MSGTTPSRTTVTGVGGTRLRALSWTPRTPRGRVLVVHGLGEHAGRYDLLAEALGRRGYALLAYDLRGHGESEGRQGHVDAFDLFVEDLAAVHRAVPDLIAGPGLPFLYGHSMGGLVLLRYLQTRRPAAPGVVLSAPWMATAAAIPRWKELLAMVLRRVAPSFPVPTDLTPEDLTRDGERQRRYLEDPLVGHRISVALYDGVLEAQRLALDAGLPDYPTLLLLPGDDRVADGRTVKRWVEAAGEGVRTVALPGFRHEPHNDVGREDVFALMADWLDDRAGEAPDLPGGQNPLE